MLNRLADDDVVHGQILLVDEVYLLLLLLIKAMYPSWFPIQNQTKPSLLSNANVR